MSTSTPTTANPNADRKVSEEGLRLIKAFEGLYLRAYYDPVGVLTIGYGHTNLSGRPPKVYPGQVITAAEADTILRDVLAHVYEPALRRNIKVPLTQPQWDAMVSWVYNLGESNLKRSRLLRRINEGRLDMVPGEMMHWVRAGGKVYRGLVRRRRAEAAMWRSLGEAPQVTPQDVQEQCRDCFDAPAPLPLEPVDKHIEKLGVGGPILTFLSSLADWRVAAVLAVTTVIILGFLYWQNRKGD